MKKIIVEKDGKPAGEIDYQDGCRIEGVCKELDIAVDEVMIGKLDNEILSYDVVPGEGVLNLVTIHSWEGSSIRMNTTLFVMLKAFHNCFNGRYKIVVEHSIGDGVYCEVFGAKLFTMDELDILLSEMITIVNDALHIEKKIYSSYESFKLFAELKRKDVLPLLYEGDNVVYECGDFYELVYAQVANTTSAAKVFDLFYHSPGFILRYPLQGSMRLREEFQFPKKLFSAHQEHDKWLNIIKLHTIKTLNSSVKNCNIREKIQIEEALQERKLVKIADEIVANRNLKLILIAGPSSSGKTTFSKRLAIHLIVSQLLSDNYVSSWTLPSLLARFMTGDLEQAEIGLSSKQTIAVEKDLGNVNTTVYQVFTYSVALDAPAVLVYPRVGRDVDLTLRTAGREARFVAVDFCELRPAELLSGLTRERTLLPPSLASQKGLSS